ncbi:DUF333 domain-containing protein [Methylobacterium crusticola]|uniref:putative hemolysin n=1 Tax=Methylobacterium crusticola TaxID=1697972 RepID=UPI000FFB523D
MVCACLIAAGAEAGQRGRSERLTLGNSASVSCAEKGGTSEIRSRDSGQTGYCRFPDGRVCEEWALLRDGRCTPPE